MQPCMSIKRSLRSCGRVNSYMSRHSAAIQAKSRGDRLNSPRLPPCTHQSQCQLHRSSAALSRWCVDRPYANPLEELEAVYSGPGQLIPDTDMVFSPTTAEIQKAQDLFRPPKGKTVEARKGVVDLEDLPPPSLPEVCFVGRSNVGKSSLVKSLFFDTKDVQRITVSKKPGHTRTLKFYTIHKRFSLVDMPGYGYNMPEHYVQSVEQYLQTRSSLQRIFLLLDASLGISPTDEIGISMLEDLGRPYTLVLTKIDKSSHSRVLLNLRAIQEFRKERMISAFPQPYLVSAHKYAGMAILRTMIGYVTGNSKLQGL